MTTETMRMPYVVDGLQADQPTEMDVPLEQIQIGETQLRVSTNHDAIREYADAIERGEELPYPALYFDGEAFWIGDGHHRIWAYHNLFDQSTIPSDVVIRAHVYRGGKREALLHAAGANASHGLRRSNADKRNAVTTLLQDDEWSEWSNREIARRCGVDEKLVRTVRDELAATAAKPQSDARRGADGRVIDTANIGARPAEPSGRAVYVEEPAESDDYGDGAESLQAAADDSLRQLHGLPAGWRLIPIDAEEMTAMAVIDGIGPVATSSSSDVAILREHIEQWRYSPFWAVFFGLMPQCAESITLEEFEAAVAHMAEHHLAALKRLRDDLPSPNVGTRMHMLDQHVHRAEVATLRPSSAATAEPKPRPEPEPEPQPEPARASLDGGFVARMRSARQAFEAAREAIPEITSIGHYDHAADTDRHLAHVIKLIDRELEPFEQYEQNTATDWGGPKPEPA